MTTAMKKTSSKVKEDIVRAVVNGNLSLAEKLSEDLKKIEGNKYKFTIVNEFLLTEEEIQNSLSFYDYETNQLIVPPENPSNLDLMEYIKEVEIIDEIEVYSISGKRTLTIQKDKTRKASMNLDTNEII